MGMLSDYAYWKRECEAAGRVGDHTKYADVSS